MLFQRLAKDVVQMDSTNTSLKILNIGVFPEFSFSDVIEFSSEKNFPSKHAMFAETFDTTEKQIWLELTLFWAISRQYFLWEKLL